jgi:hypothetical protein
VEPGSKPLRRPTDEFGQQCAGHGASSRPKLLRQAIRQSQAGKQPRVERPASHRFASNRRRVVKYYLKSTAQGGNSNVAPRVKKTNRPKRVGSVRASKDGHQFHEAWVARRALGLLLPRFDLYGIAVEGLSEEDEEGAPAAAVEIADATFYDGNGKSFECCVRMEVAQFKYSIGKANDTTRRMTSRATASRTRTHCCSWTGSCECFR